MPQTAERAAEPGPAGPDTRHAAAERAAPTSWLRLSVIALWGAIFKRTATAAAAGEDENGLRPNKRPKPQEGWVEETRTNENLPPVGSEPNAPPRNKPHPLPQLAFASLLPPGDTRCAAAVQGNAAAAATGEGEEVKDGSPWLAAESLQRVDTNAPTPSVGSEPNAPPRNKTAPPFHPPPLSSAPHAPSPIGARRAEGGKGGDPLQQRSFDSLRPLGDTRVRLAFDTNECLDMPREQWDQLERLHAGKAKIMILHVVFQASPRPRLGTTRDALCEGAYQGVYTGQRSDPLSLCVQEVYGLQKSQKPGLAAKARRTLAFFDEKAGSDFYELQVTNPRNGPCAPRVSLRCLSAWAR